MTATRTELRVLEGQQVSLTLTDGTHMDTCSLVSAGRTSVGTLWVFANGDDTFIPRHEVIAIRATASPNVPALAATPRPPSGADRSPTGAVSQMSAGELQHTTGKEEETFRC
jgi:hypothetical protein